MQYVLIHGLGQTPFSWEKTISFLSKTNYVHSPDLWAMLNSENITYDNLYRAFTEFCDSTSGRLNLCGLSLGGILALHYAIEHPERLQSIVLIGAQHKMPKGLLKFQNVIFRLMPEKSFEKMGLPKREMMRFATSMADLNFSKQLKDITCPALIICGNKDSANKKAANDFFHRIPGAKLLLIENAGHELNIEAPRELASILNTFWKELPDR